MSPEKLRELIVAQPFRMFWIRLPDGRKLPVVHREFVSLSPNGRTAVLFQPDDSMNILDVMLITDIEVHPDAHPESVAAKGA